MTGEEAPDLVPRLQAAYGDALHGVAIYDRDGYEMLDIREDLAAGYPDETLQEIWEEILLSEIEEERTKQLYHHLGGVLGRIEVFEQGVVSFFRKDGDGVCVALAREADPEIFTLAEHCGFSVE